MRGSPPAPSPRVRRGPNWILVGARELFRAWLSVLAAIYSTPDKPNSIMRFTALQPPPPKPITFNTGGRTVKEVRCDGFVESGIFIGSPLCELCCNRCAISDDPANVAASQH